MDSGAVLTVGSDGVFTYDQGVAFDGLSAGEEGADSFTYTISDGAAETTATASIAILGANDAPIAFDDAFSVLEGAVVTGDLGADNGAGADADPDTADQALSLIALNGQGDLTQTLSSGAIVTLTPDGGLTYQTNNAFDQLREGEVASDSFSYVISDGVATDEATVTLTITGVNDAPIARPDTFATDEDTLLTGLFLLADNGQGADSDVDGETLTLSAIGGVAVVAGDVVTLASGAKVTLGEDGAISYDPNGAFEALEDGETAIDSFAYQITDGAGASAEAEALIEIAGQTDVIFGTDDADIIEGGGDEDEIRALAGDDLISGFGGDDVIDAGAGADRARGGLGDDSADGGDGDDTLFGEGGDDTLSGGAGDDRLRGQRGEDLLLGDAGDDILAGARDADTLRGGVGDDTLLGGGGADRLNGQAGADKINGGRGDDDLLGGRGGDRLNGGGGDDTLTGGAGDDTLIGGGGADTFRFDAADGADVLRGFQQGLDVIDITSGASGFADLTLIQNGGNTEITIGATSVLAVGQDVEAFGEDDFIF